MAVRKSYDAASWMLLTDGRPGPSPSRGFVALAAEPRFARHFVGRKYPKALAALKATGKAFDLPAKYCACFFMPSWNFLERPGVSLPDAAHLPTI